MTTVSVLHDGADVYRGSPDRRLSAFGRFPAGWRTMRAAFLRGKSPCWSLSPRFASSHLISPHLASIRPSPIFFLSPFDTHRCDLRLSIVLGHSGTQLKNNAFDFARCVKDSKTYCLAQEILWRIFFPILKMSKIIYLIVAYYVGKVSFSNF